MDRVLVRKLADCSEFRQTVLAQPPRFVHATTILLVVLLVTGFTWLALTRANLVVRAPGRIRPLVTATKVFSPGRGKVLGNTADAKVAEVTVREGVQVQKGDVLVRLESERLDNEVAKLTSTLEAAEAELTRLSLMEELQTAQHAAALAKSDAELAEMKIGHANEKESKAADIQLAQVELNLARGELDRLMPLLKYNAIPDADVARAKANFHAAEERLAKAKVSLNTGRLEVLQRGRTVAEKDYHVRRAELALRRGSKKSERDTTRLELANLKLELEQTVLRAPLDGVVITGDLKVGDILEPGKPIIEIAAQTGFRFEVAVASDDVGKLRAELPARLKLDAFDYQKYGTLPGKVSYLAPDSTMTKGQAQPVYLVKVDMADTEIGQGEYRGQVRLGMAGQAEIITDQDSLLSVLLRTVRQTISLD